MRLLAQKLWQIAPWSNLTSNYLELDKGEEEEARPKNYWDSPGSTHSARSFPTVQFHSLDNL